MGCLMIFGGPEAYDDKRRLKTARREVHAVNPAVGYLGTRYPMVAQETS